MSWGEIVSTAALLVPLGTLLHTVRKDNREFKVREDERSRQLTAIADDLTSVKTTVTKNSTNLAKVSDGVMRTQRYYLQKDLTKAILRGWTTQNEFDELSKLYESYENLGGNGAIKHMFEKFLALPLKEEEIA